MSERDMKKIVYRLTNLHENIYTLTNRAGELINLEFQKLPPRTGTDYYKFITRPISLHTIGRTIKRFQYKDAQGFVDDLAQITWNARHYNEPGSVIYENALVLDNYIRDTVIPKLSSDPVIPNASALHYPDLGPLDDYSGVGRSEDGLHGKNEDDEDEENQQTHRYTSHSVRSHGGHKPQEGAVRRGRPPIIDKPYEARIKTILKALKRLRSPEDEEHLVASHFERLPDKSQTDYYEMVAYPISLHEIRTRVRSRKYTTVQQFLDDLVRMVSNAKTYFAADPTMVDDLFHYEKEAEKMIEQEMSRPDEEFSVTSNTGTDKLRIPLDVISVDGHSYKVGDWVLIKNPNDGEKPICGQIFRLWSADGVQYTNVCWYIRPEQTCHRADRLFYINEVCKTGEYSDHLAADIVAPCYVIFLTHYQKGDIPTSLLPDGAEWFICEFRYNANTYAFNRIRTWKACLPDEIRQLDQPIVPIHEPRKLIKYDSPLRHLLQPDSPDDASKVQPTDGPHPNGPPLVGAVFRKPPFDNDELGQCSTSPNVTRAPELDDVLSGREAYMFVPVSQLKNTGGGNNSVAQFSSGTKQVSANYSPSHIEDSPAPYESPSVKEGSYSTPTPGVKPFAKPEQVPSALAHATGSYQATTSVYSAVLPNGVVSYQENIEVKVGEDEKDFAAISQSLINAGGNPVWFRSPPTVVSQRVITPVGHSAKYLAWKLKRNQKA